MTSPQEDPPRPQVGALKMAVVPKEEKPQPALPTVDETAKARSLLAQARQALKQGNFALARQLNEQARECHSNLLFSDDHPDRLAADLARAEGAAKGNAVAAGPGAPAKPGPGSSGPQGPAASTGKNQDGASALLATSTSSLLGPTTRPTPPQRPTVPTPGTPGNRKEDAVVLLRLGRGFLDKGKLDEATQAMLKAKAMTVKWGLFDADNPDKLRRDLDKARTKRNQEESVKVLAEGWRLFKAGDLDGAQKKAYEAQTLHGTYPHFDPSERPSDLQAKIEATRHQQRILGTPARSADTALVKNTPAGGADPRTLPGLGTQQQTGLAQNPPRPGPQGPPGRLGGAPPAPAGPARPGPQTDPNRENARLELADARLWLQKGDIKRAATLVDHVRTLNVRFNPGEDTPEAVSREIELARSGKPPTGQQGTTALAKGPTPPPAAPTPRPVTPNATQLVPPGGMALVADGLGSQLPASNVIQAPFNPLQPSVSDSSRSQQGPPPYLQARPGLPVGVAGPSGPAGLNKPLLPGVPPQEGMINTPDQTMMALKKAQAQKLLQEARRLQKENKLIEAWARACEAQKVGAWFGPQEDSPALTMEQLAGQTRQRIEFLQKNGTEVANYGNASCTPAQRFQAAEACFLEAKQLALAFGQDVQPIEGRLAWLAGELHWSESCPAGPEYRRAGSGPQGPAIARCCSVGPEIGGYQGGAPEGGRSVGDARDIRTGRGPAAPRSTPRTTTRPCSRPAVALTPP